MAGVNKFLESVSIGGLSHISNAGGKYARLFWLVIVLFGNILAGLIIFESFVDWAKNPIRTTIKTKPITELKFPNVTVCPPHNTFTDLNYDLMMVGNKTLSKEERHDLFEYAVELVEEHVFMDNLNKLLEQNRFFNWYHGFTTMPIYQYLSQNDMTMRNYPGYWQYILRTSAASGELTTQYFGDEFKPELVEREVTYRVTFYPPENNQNITIHWTLEKISMIEFSNKVSTDTITLYGAVPFPGDKFFNYSGKIGSRNFDWGLEFNNDIRGVEKEDLELMKLDLMPGFRLKWYYTGDEVFSKSVLPPTKQQDVEFVRIV